MSQILVETPPTRVLKDALNEASRRLRRALADPIAGREREWSETVGRALLEEECELRRHRALNQDADGPVAALDATRPTLLRQWSALCHDYRDLADRVQRLRTDASHAAEAFQPVGEALEEATTPLPVPPVSRGVPVFGFIREQAEELLIHLQTNRETETALLLESVTTDIGVGD